MESTSTNRYGGSRLDEVAMLDPRQLQALAAVAAEGSVARAAKRLGWSQPTVDYHLKNLDRLVGTDLTSRSTRGSRLTIAGQLMHERGEEILALADRALTDVRDLAQRATPHSLQKPIEATT